MFLTEGVLIIDNSQYVIPQCMPTNLQEDSGLVIFLAMIEISILPSTGLKIMEIVNYH